MEENIIFVNGSPYEYIKPFSAQDLLLYLGFNTDVILVDYNGSILQKEEWPTIFLQNQDRIEIITLAGGG